MKKLMTLLLIIFCLGAEDNVFTRDSTWVDSTGCYHTLKFTYNMLDSTWVPADSVIKRCPKNKKLNESYKFDW